MGGALQKAKDKISQSSENDLIDSGYAHQCEKRMGFDNWRTFSSFAIDPNQSDTMYVAIEYKGVYKSEDEGETWTSKNKGLRGYASSLDLKVPCHEQHPLLVIDPTNSQRLFLTSASSPGYLTDMNSENAGLYESVDGGESWHQLFKNNMNAWTYEALAMDPKDPQTVYVGTTAMPASYDEADLNKLFVTKGIIYKTVNGGNDWEELATGLVPDLRSGKIFINPFDPNNIIFTTMALASNKGGGSTQGTQMGILESNDAGATWVQLQSLPKDERAIAEADISKNFQNIFITVRKQDQNESKYYSKDGGITFNQVNTAVNKFGFDPHDSKGLRLLGFSVFGTPGNLFESLDGGKTWHTYSSLPKGVNNELRISNIVWDPNNKDLVYLNGEQGNIWKSVDGGKTWENILNLDKLVIP